MAIIGASPQDLATLAHTTTKIRDRLFLVNPKYREVRGKRCYPRLLEVESDIEYALIIVAAPNVPQVLEECIQKGVKVAQIYSAGFSETGVPERVELERKIKKMTEGRIRVIGPNCFGVYCPRSGLSIVPESPEEEGHVGVIAQSGSVVESFSYFARTKNLRFSKMVSFGNALDLDGPDFLEHLAERPGDEDHRGLPRRGQGPRAAEDRARGGGKKEAGDRGKRRDDRAGDEGGRFSYRFPGRQP